MANDENFKDPFNWWYFFAVAGTLVAFPLLHVVLAWLKFYFQVI